MARRRQSIAIAQIEKKLGYATDYYCLNNNSAIIGDTAITFYSDLTPVSENRYDHAARELEEHNKQKRQGIVSLLEGIDCSGVRTILMHGETLMLERTSHIGIYNSLLHLHHPALGFHLPLRLTRNEASRVLAVNKFPKNGSFDTTSIFFKLPQEIRNKIYEFSIPDREWKVNNVAEFSVMTFVGTIGDPTGFYFPLGDELSLLRVSKQMRQEALPIAYGRTSFRLDDIDEFVRVAVSIGDIGRANIEAVEFAWESRGDSQRRQHLLDNEYANTTTTAAVTDLEKFDMQVPPSLHVERCTQLLKECSRLKLVRLYYEDGFIPDIYFAVNIQIPPRCTIAALTSAADFNGIISRAVLKVAHHKHLNAACVADRNHFRSCLTVRQATKEALQNDPEVQIECAFCCY